LSLLHDLPTSASAWHEIVSAGRHWLFWQSKPAGQSPSPPHACEHTFAPRMPTQRFPPHWPALEHPLQRQLFCAEQTAGLPPQSPFPIHSTHVRESKRQRFLMLSFAVQSS
jgi:hypothetical protein